MAIKYLNGSEDIGFISRGKQLKKICQEKHIMGHFTKHERMRGENASQEVKGAQNVDGATNAAGDVINNKLIDSYLIIFFYVIGAISFLYEYSSILV